MIKHTQVELLLNIPLPNLQKKLFYIGQAKPVFIVFVLVQSNNFSQLFEVTLVDTLDGFVDIVISI
jgi:hypothetical protein